MSRHFLSATILLLLATLLPTQAQDIAGNERLVGYTTNDNIDVSGAAFGQVGTYTVGAITTESMTDAYAGCKVVGVRFAVSQSIGRTRAFLYTVDGNDVKEIVSQTQRTYEGWNKVMFNGDGFTIEEGKQLFFGYDYVETDEMVAADKGALCGVGDDIGGSFVCYGNFGSGLDIYTLSNIGCLCVQLIVDITNLPMHDLALTYTDIGHNYKKKREMLEIFTEVTNVGRDTVFNYTMGYSIDDMQPTLLTVKDALAPGKSEQWTTTPYQLPETLATGSHTVKTFVAAIEGEDASTQLNDTIISTFILYDEAFKRDKLYIEVYNDQTSYNGKLLNDVMQEVAKTRSDVCLANVYMPGNPLAMKETEYLCDLYAYTYPSFTFNRAYFPGEAHIAYDMNDYLTQFPTAFSAAILSDMAYQDAESPAFAKINLKPAYNPQTRLLSIDADGEVVADADKMFGDVAVTLLLTESKIKGYQIVADINAGKYYPSNNYEHDNVVRAFLTAPTGDKVNLSGNTFTSHFELTLPDTYKPENMELIAIVTKATNDISAENLTYMNVLNTNSVKLITLDTVGISDMQQAAGNNATDAAVYSLSGQKLNSNARRNGLVIVRQPNGTTKKIISR